MIEYLFVAFVAIMSIVLFAMMGIDKSKAIKKEWRIPERRLFTIAIFGGAIGGLIGMYLFHHKTKHPTFSVGFPVLAVIQLLIVYWMFT